MSSSRRRPRRLHARPAAAPSDDAISLPLEVEINEAPWCQAASAGRAAPGHLPLESSVDEDRDGIPHAEFLAVLASLQSQKDLGLRVNEKGNQICQLSWLEFSQRVPFYWTDDHPNVCPLCKKKLSSRFSLSRHYIDVHHREEKKLPPPAPCQFCSKILYNQSTLNRHILTVHKEAASAAAAAAEEEEERSSFYCPLCRQRHADRAEVTRHVHLLRLQDSRASQLARRPVGTDNPAGGPEGDGGSPSDDVRTHLVSPRLAKLLTAPFQRAAGGCGPFPCSVCRRTFLDQDLLVAHLSGHLRDKQADCLPSGRCPLCDVTVPQLVSHIRDEHCRVCVRCGLILPEALMERHITAHDLKMAFWCPVCGQREDRRVKMMQHIGRQHEYIAEGSQFQCGACGHVRAHNLITHCLKHARDDALTAYWFKQDVLSAVEQRGLEAGRLLLTDADDAALQWLPEPAAAAISVSLLSPSDAVAGSGLDAAALLSASLCPVCAGPAPSGRQLGDHLQRHGELPLLFCPACPRTFCRPAPAGRHRCARLLCLLCGLQVAPAQVAPHWALHAADDAVCALLAPPENEPPAAEREEPPCGILERQMATELARYTRALANGGGDGGETEDGHGESQTGHADDVHGKQLRWADASSGADRISPIEPVDENSGSVEKGNGEAESSRWKNGREKNGLNGEEKEEEEDGAESPPAGRTVAVHDSRDLNCGAGEENGGEQQDNGLSAYEDRSGSVFGEDGGQGSDSSGDLAPPAKRRHTAAVAEHSRQPELACELCRRRLRSVSQLRRHRLFRHGERRGPLRCPRCPGTFFLPEHRRLHACGGGGGGGEPVCRRCGAEPAAARSAWLVSAAGRRALLTVCQRCHCPLPGAEAGSSDGGGGGGWRPAAVTVPGGAAVCGQCDVPLPAGASALLERRWEAPPGPAARRLCVPCAEQTLSAQPRLAARLWRPEATLGALWCASCCQPLVSLHQLRLHCLRLHADVL